MAKAKKAEAEKEKGVWTGIWQNYFTKQKKLQKSQATVKMATT